MLETGVHVWHLPGLDFVLMGSRQQDTNSNVHVKRCSMAGHACINYMFLVQGCSDDLIAPGGKEWIG